MGLFEDIENKRNVFNFKPFTLKDFNEVLSKIDNAPVNRQPLIFASTNQHEYMSAVISNDKTEILRLESLFTAEAFKILKSDHESMYGHGYDVFCELERLYKRKTSRTGHIEWDTRMIFNSENEYMEPSTAIISYYKGRYSSYIIFYDEFGYDNQTVYLCKDTEPQDLMKILKNKGL